MGNILFKLKKYFYIKKEKMKKSRELSISKEIKKDKKKRDKS